MFFLRLGMSKQVFERRVTRSKSTPAHSFQELREKSQVLRFRECETRRSSVFAPARLHCALIKPIDLGSITVRRDCRTHATDILTTNATCGSRARTSDPRPDYSKHGAAKATDAAVLRLGRDGRVAGVRSSGMSPRGALRAKRGRLGDLPAVRLLGVVVVDPCPRVMYISRRRQLA